jgi:hypothetical protein
LKFDDLCSDLLATISLVKGRRPTRGDVIRVDQEKVFSEADLRRGTLGGGGNGGSIKPRRFVGASKAMATFGVSNASPPTTKKQTQQTKSTLLDGATERATSSPTEKRL